MNADYSFTDPTWKLPPIANPSNMHPGTYDTSQLPPGQNVNDDTSTWNNQQEQGEYYSQADPYSQPPAHPYQQPEQQFFQSGPVVPQHPPPPQPQSYQQPEQQFFQPRPPVSHPPHHQQQQQEKQFPPPGPPAPHHPPPHPQTYQQPEQQFFQPGPPAPHPSHQPYQQPEEQFMHNRIPPSHPQVGERSKPPGPPAPSQPPQFYQPPRERFIEQNAPLPHPQFNQQSNNQHRNIGNHSDNFDFSHNTNTEHRTPRQQQQQQQQRNHGFPNEQHNNQGRNFPPLPQQAPRRLQNADPNHQSFFTDFAPNRENDHSPEKHNFEPKTKSHGHSSSDDMFDSIHSNNPRTNRMNIHEYLYGLSVADSGSYVKAFKNQRRLLTDERNNHRGVMNEYKSFLKNGGFGPQFGKVNQQTLQEKMEIENRKKLYSKQVRAVNQQKIEDQMRLKNSGEQLRNRSYASPVIQHRRPHELTSHLLFTPEVKEFERKIKRDHDASCKCSLHSRPFHSSA